MFADQVWVAWVFRVLAVRGWLHGGGDRWCQDCIHQQSGVSSAVLCCAAVGLGGSGSEGGWEMEDLELPADLGLGAAATAAAAAGAPFVAPTPGEYCELSSCVRVWCAQRRI